MGVRVREKVKGSGVWWVFIAHRRRRKSIKVGSKKSARKLQETIEARLKLGKEFLPDEKPTSPTLKEYFDRFRDTYLDTAVRHSTRNSYLSMYHVQILPELGSRRLNEIDRATMEDFVGKLVRKNLAKDSIRHIIAVLCVLINHAKERGIVHDNPATRLSKFYKQARKRHPEIEPLTEEEVVLFLQAAQEHFTLYYPLFLCAIHTGLRSGELAGLQWWDIDFNGKFLTVRRSIVQGRINPTKTDKIRRVDMSDDLLEELSELKRLRKEQWLSRGRNEIPDWVFCNREGNFPDMNNLKNRHFFKCLEKAGLRRIRFHETRHTFASLLIQNGESLAYVKEQLGHSSIKMTVDVYGHLVPGANRQAVNRLPSLRNRPGAEIKSQAK